MDGRNLIGTQREQLHHFVGGNARKTTLRINRLDLISMILRIKEASEQETLNSLIHLRHSWALRICFTSWLVGLIPVNSWWNLTAWFKWAKFATFYFTQHKSDAQRERPAAKKQLKSDFAILYCKMDSDKPGYSCLFVYHPRQQTTQSLA